MTTAKNIIRKIDEATSVLQRLKDLHEYLSSKFEGIEFKKDMIIIPYKYHDEKGNILKIMEKAMRFGFIRPDNKAGLMIYSVKNYNK